jgi:hypothetical protein
MKTTILFSLFAFLAFADRPAHAQSLSLDSDEDGDKPVTVMIELGATYSGAAGFPSGTGVITKERTRVPGSTLPDREKREAVFTRVPGLQKNLEGMDELDRDLLYVRSQQSEPADLAKRYPKIPADTLKRLAEEARKP